MARSFNGIFGRRSADHQTGGSEHSRAMSAFHCFIDGRVQAEVVGGYDQESGTAGHANVRCGSGSLTRAQETEEFDTLTQSAFGQIPAGHHFRGQFRNLARPEVEALVERFNGTVDLIGA